MQNNCVLIAWNETLLIRLDFWNVTSYDMHKIYIFTEYFVILNLWYQNLKLDKTYLPKGS